MNDQDRITQLESACAAKDKALESALAGMWDGHYSGKGVTKEYAQAVDREVKAALATDSGKALLDRLQAVEKERDELVSSHQICVGAAGIGDFSELCGWIDGVKRERDRLLDFGWKAQFQLTEVSKACSDLIGWDEIDADEVNKIINLGKEALQPAQKDAPEKGTK